MPIQKLSPLIANQIAAGEVVERPASVVKELLENSIDAGSTRIQIDLERGGTRLIRVTDNGVGIIREELSLALSRHATSKIIEAKDLEAISTLGFRGEALASISSVAKLTLSSKPEAQEIGWSAYTEGQDMEVVMKPHSLPFGSIVEVKDLFFNTPARQKFLKAERTEFIHVEEVVKKIALANPQLAITLKHNGKVTKRVPAANTDEQIKQRVGSIVGRPFIQKAININSQLEDLQLTGWLGPVDYHQSSSFSQYFFVNGRPVRDRTINHAVRQAYQDLLPEGRSPAFVLFLKLPADKLDINVHPTKHEVRFIDGRRVHDYIIKAIETCLDDYGNNGFSQDIFEHKDTSALSLESERGYLDKTSFEESSKSNVMSSASNYLAALSKVSEREAYYQPKNSLSKTKNTQILFGRYLLQNENEKIFLLDLKSYLINFIQINLNDEWSQQNVKQKPILIPIRLQIKNQKSLDVVLENVSNLGFDISQLGPESIIIRKVPSLIEQIDINHWLNSAFDNLEDEGQIKSSLLNNLSLSWQPDPKTNWQEVIEQKSELTNWKTSEYCYLIKENDLEKLILCLRKS